MRLAETVTFGGSGLDRAAHLRGDADGLAKARRDPDSRAVVIWRSKPLFEGEARETLVRVPLDHPVLIGAREMIFLGREGSAALFGADISHWEPGEIDAEALAAFFDPSEQVHPKAPKGSAFCELRGVMSRISPRDAEVAATAKAILSWHRSHRFCAKCGHESEMIMAGWQRACPGCGAQHFPRTDPVVIMLITRGNKVLMGRSHGWPEGMYSLLAGFVEPGEAIEAAVRREVEEEAAIRVGRVDYLASQPWPYPSSLMIGCRGEALSDEITIDPVEIETAQWFTREEIADAFSGQNPRMKPARKGSIAHFLLWNWLADRLD
ncbi:NAD(+) diphosphatase [Aquicoccus porphyridii]|uniref:NAD(+) diphosphatase n=1 Tax=Aquicoccus porphyridii TaxID=1852029 RepID=A0A5A9ZK40_9RHOB|nr:NAD(+) diphosphatase [Aquicoccus porphyridii]KAA0917683.1 NAD(+) diphosphatase [Aquicoccus porphyridii]RAI55757.1 NAD(+) diphosphatase [Rhodobacteraceae bacterium AsT-22]